MPALAPHYLTLLERVLTDRFVPHLPALLDQTKPAEQQQRKNLSRAFSAFALHHLCGVTERDAAQAVVDDFDDFGVDAIFYHSLSDTLYLVQAKLKTSETFRQDEALAFCQGVRKLIKQDFSGFNLHVQNRLIEIEDALDTCSHLQLVVAHTGSDISNHAKAALTDLLRDDNHGEERFASTPLDYDASRVVAALQDAHAYESVHADLCIQKCYSIQEPRTTYFGLMQLEDLVRLHERYGKALYEKNIRTFLGTKTDVNTSIRQALEERPAEFLYLNNGIAALCQTIDPKGQKSSPHSCKRLQIRGLSVINGAQTIASAARFVQENSAADISKARVSVTLIRATATEDFGKAVTRARNHQNPVSLASFVALDNEQERLRRELAHLGVHYVYKSEAADNNPNRIQVDEAAQALALFCSDPRFAVWLKKEPARLLDTSGDQYRLLFSTDLTPFRLVNAVRFSRYVQLRMSNEAGGARDQERLAYKHGNHALGWVLAKRVRDAQLMAKLLDEGKLQSQLSAPLDELRQALWAETQKLCATKGPLAFYGSQTDVVPLLIELMIQKYSLSADPVVGIKRNQQSPAQPYASDLVDYLISKAPQISNLA